MSNATLAMILSPLLALAFIVFGVQKIPPNNLIFQTLADNSGIGLFEPVIRVLTGVAELVAGGLLLFNRTRMTGAALGLLVLLGAVGFHLSPWLGINVPGVGSGLFYIAMTMLALNVINAVALRKNGEKLLFVEK
jgi:uncharacterized membrane protein YphA (DoxX/SURF4 family)